MKKKVKVIYVKRIEFEAEIEQEDLDKVYINGMPDWVDEKANEIDNEQPVEFMMYKVI